MSSEYLDIVEVAERLKVSVRTVYTYRSSGRLPEPDIVVRRSAAWRPETIDAYIAGVAPNANVRRRTNRRESKRRAQESAYRWWWPAA